MRWTEHATDTPPSSLADLLRTLSLPDAVVLVAQARRAPVVFLSPACHEGILAHLRTRAIELGGLLIGRPFLPGPDFPAACGPVIAIDGFLPSRQSRSGRLSLAMGTELWDRARDAIVHDGRWIVGWYHSHPNLGAFFSSTDRATQRAFFNQPYSVGLVIDPIRNEEAWFVGAEAAPLTSRRLCPLRGGESTGATEIGERKNAL